MNRIDVVKPTFRKLDATAAPLLRAQLLAAWSVGARLVAIDLTGVAYVDSLGLSALVAENRARPAAARIVVVGLTEYVREVFEISRLAELFDVFESVSALRASLAQADAAHAG